MEVNKLLILTRRVGETINIGDDIKITVLGVKGNQVRIGCTVPKEIPVHREEIAERIAREKLSTDSPNLQNIPIRTPEGRRIHQAFAPDNSLVAADFSQSELRVMARLSGDNGGDND